MKLYTTKHSTPGELADAVGTLFPGSSLRALASSSGHLVVLSGSSNDIEQAHKVLDALDRPAVVVAVELLIMEPGVGPLDLNALAARADKTAAADPNSITEE